MRSVANLRRIPKRELKDDYLIVESRLLYCGIPKRELKEQSEVASGDELGPHESRKGS